MVIKICKICGKEFNAKGRDLCCSPECSKENKREHDAQWRKDNPEYMSEYQAQWYKDNRERARELNAQWRKDNREHKREYDAQWRKDNPEYDAQRYKDNRDKIIEKKMLRDKKIISKLCDQYDGDLKQILENIPSRWQVREAKMRVWFGESYFDGMIAKINSTPVCEVTGEKTNDLVIHHLYSFNTHPELGADPNNMVRVCADIHKKFHSIYGYGNNTPDQWVEFVENY